jgi:nicotinamide-nucleotide amidase
MNAELITIGDEILIGQVVDTNSAFMGKAFNKAGISIYQITSIQDDKNHIIKALKAAEANADIIIITGGLGPTKDDITKHTLCDFFNDELVLNENVLAHVTHLFETYIKKPLLEANKSQAMVPSKAKVLPNQFGTAPGMWFEKNGKVFVSLPGVPYEMKALITDKVLPRLQEKFNLPYIIHKTVLTYGLGESALADRIAAWEDALPKSIKLAYLPSLGRVRLRLSSKGTNKKTVESLIDIQVEKLLPQIEDIFVGFEDKNTIETRIGELLVEQNKTIAVAESCTGGCISQNFMANSGASRYFKGAAVTYSTESKIKVLGISEVIINKHSVVSQQVAEEMATKVKFLYNADYGISTTGNAGPTKGDSDAGIGTVYIAIATPTEVYSHVFQFSNQRKKTIAKATNKAMELFLKEISKKSQ